MVDSDLPSQKTKKLRGGSEDFVPTSIINKHFNICPSCESDTPETGKKFCAECNDKIRLRICTSCSGNIKMSDMPNAKADHLGRCIYCSELNYCQSCGESPITAGEYKCEDCKEGGIR